MEMGVPEQMDYWNFAKPDLDNFLAKFWFGAHKDTDDSQDSVPTEDPELKGQMYKATT